MQKSKKYPASRLMPYFIFFIILMGFILTFIALLFKPYYKVTMDGEFIGYYKSYEEYEDFYNKIPKQISEDGISVDRYCTKNPVFEKKYVKVKYAKGFNNYDLIEKHLTKEYIIYCIKVNGEEKFYAKTNEAAEKLVEEIKKEVKKSTEIIIQKIFTKDKSLVCDDETINSIKKEVIKTNYKVSSRGGGIRVNTANSKYIWPTTTRTITSNFGKREAPTSKSSNNHTGIDIAVCLNSNVYAVDDGKVILAGWNGSYGYQVKIQHSNNVVTTYAHCNKILVKKGQTVSQGDIIARSGSTGNSTGPHLHFEYIKDGVFKNPLLYI